MRLLSAGILALIFSVGLHAADQKTGKSALDKPTFEAWVRHLLLWGPQIGIQVSDPIPSEIDGFLRVKVTGTAGEASQEEYFYVSKDGRQVLRASVFDIDKNPFHKEIEQLTTTYQPSLGTAGAPVRIVMFTDFECPFCRQEAEMLRANLLKEYPKQVRLYFKDFPLESIHPWAKTAAIAGRCIYDQKEESFWNYHDWIFKNQGAINAENVRDKILGFAQTLTAIDTLRLTACIDNKETENEVNQSIAEARALHVNATPTMFINGRRIARQLPWKNLKQIIDFELDYQKTANNAGDRDCCSVELPTPLAK